MSILVCHQLMLLGRIQKYVGLTPTTYTYPPSIFPFVQILGLYFSGAVIGCCAELLICGLNVTSPCIQNQSKMAPQKTH